MLLRIARAPATLAGFAVFAALAGLPAIAPASLHAQGAGKSAGPGASSAVAQVQVTPDQLTLAPGQRQALAAAAYDGQGNVIANARFVFRSTDPAVVQVDRSGRVVALRPGSATVEVRLQNRQAAARVRVTGPARPASTARASSGAKVPPRAEAAGTAAPPPADSSAPAPRAPGASGAPDAPSGIVLTLDPPSAYLLPSEPLRLAPRTLKEDGTPAEPVRVTWKSLRPEIATVDAEGLVVGVAPGQAIIKADGPGALAATAAVDVAVAEFALAPARLALSPGASDTVRAVVPAQGGRALRGGVVWRSSDTTVVRVGPTGIVTALAPGRAEIVASGFFQERRVPVAVHQLPVALVVSPRLGAPLVLPRHATLPVAARAVAADSSTVAEAGITWSVADSAIAAYDTVAHALVAKAEGTTTLSATLPGFDPATWTVRVIPGHIALDHARLAVGLGERATLGARVLDDSNRVVGAVSTARWTSSRPEIAAVDADGVVVGTGLGRTTITATSAWGQTAAADVFGVGELLVASDRSGSWTIYALRTATPDVLTPIYFDGDSATVAQAVPAPDRTRVAFSSNRAAGEVAGGNKGGGFGIWVMDADGRNARRVSPPAPAGTGAADGEPAWTPDGQRLVFSSTRDGAGQIYSMRLDGSDLRQLTASKGANVSPAVSPDGHTIAFVSTREGTADVWLMNADGSNPRRLAATREREEQPRWFPDGQLGWLVQRGERGGTLLVRHALAPAAAGAAGAGGAAGGAAAAPAPLVTSADPILSWAVSRDGRRLAYVTGRVTDRASGRTEYRFLLQDAEPGAPPVAVPLRPGEQAVSPSF
ncbi:MAG TPA: Ig-like domain-containing protein [Gemmatimonadales bacterium]|nr:Ig-like domain-containing protein [Gemmatimonadales bacterium]